MEKNVLIILIIVVAAITLLCAGYYVYINYFIPVPSAPSKTPPAITMTPGGPKEAYIKYLTEVSETKALEDFYKITIKYGYFDSPEQKEEASATSAADIKKMSPSQKIQELRYLREIAQSELVAASQLTEAINDNEATLSSPTEGLTINMIKEQGAWKIK